MRVPLPTTYRSTIDAVSGDLCARDSRNPCLPDLHHLPVCLEDPENSGDLCEACASGRDFLARIVIDQATRMHAAARNVELANLRLANVTHALRPPPHTHEVNVTVTLKD